MKVALIPPVSELVTFCTGRKYQLILPHLVIENEQYRNFYKYCDGYKILDNGAAESRHVSAHDLLQIAADLDVDEVVVPDVLGDTFGTVEAARAFESYARRCKQFKYMGVVQGKNTDEVQRCITYFSLQEWVHVVALPRCLNKRSPDFRQFVLSKYRRQLRNGFDAIHCLGMSSNITEPAMLARYGARSLDTSLPFSMAFGGQTIDTEGDNTYVPRQEEYFDLHFEYEQYEAARQNVQMLDMWSSLMTLEGYKG